MLELRLFLSVKGTLKKHELFAVAITAADGEAPLGTVTSPGTVMMKFVHVLVRDQQFWDSTDPPWSLFWY